MIKPEDFDPENDYTVTSEGEVIGYMHARHWGDASSPILISTGDGEWQSSGRQVGDFRHDSDAAARTLFGDEVDPDTIEIE